MHFGIQKELLPDMAENFLATIPALPPPPGVVSNFENPPSEATSIITVTAVFLAFMLAMVMMRIYTKGWIIRSLGWDDCKGVSDTGAKC